MTSIKFCPKCNNTFDETKKFCGKCGVPLDTRENDDDIQHYVPAGPSPDSPKKVLWPETDTSMGVNAGHKPQDVITVPPLPGQEPSVSKAVSGGSLSLLTKNRTVLYIGIMVAIVILAGGYFAYNHFFVKGYFLGKIDRALSEGRFFSPPNNNVEQIFREQKAKSPDSAEIKEATKRIITKLTQIGDDVLQRLYSDSDDMGWDNVVRIYAFLSEISPGDKEIQARAEFTKGHEIIKGGSRSDYVNALSCYQRALQSKPNWVLAINGIAKVYVRKNSPFYNKIEALNYYNKASEADPNFPWAYTNIAAIYSEDRQWGLAEQALLKALRIKSDRSSIIIELGNICEKQKKQQEAAHYYREALKYEKSSEKANLLQKKLNAIPLS